MGLHFLAFMGANFNNRKKSMLVQRMNSAGLNSNNIVKNVVIDIDGMNIVSL